MQTGLVSQSCCARIGLVGNPSDGFDGKTLSLLLQNFQATVSMEASNCVEIIPHRFFDLIEHTCLSSLSEKTSVQGFYGGHRLLLATSKAFADRCKRSCIENRITQGFKMSYTTNIPQMVGLSGSSAIIIAAFRALLVFFSLSLTDLRLTKAEVPSFILSIEKDYLGIAAGLQDRVIQTYGGLVHMDFSPAAVDPTAQPPVSGRFTPLDPAMLPPLYLAYNTGMGGESGKVHSTVSQRWRNGDADVISGMLRLGELADAAVTCLESNDSSALAKILDTNFALRRGMYGDDAVGRHNVAVAEMAGRDLGLAAKFTGSGGAFVLLRKTGEGWLDPIDEDKTRSALAQVGFRLERVEVGEQCVWPE